MEDKEYELIRAVNEADYYLEKTFIHSLMDFRLYPLTETEKSYRYMRLYRITKLVYDAEEDINDKLTSVYSAIMPFTSNLVLIVKGMIHHAEIYIGVKSNRNVGIAQGVLNETFLANFPGSTMEQSAASDVLGDISTYSEDIFENAGKSVACINLVPSLRGNKKEAFVQGLDKFIETMKGQEYICELLATPLSSEEIKQRKLGLEELYSLLSPFEKRTLSKGRNEGYTMTKGITESFSQSVSNGVSLSTGTSVAETRTTTKGNNFGVHFLFDYGISNSTSYSMGSTKNIGRTNTDTVTVQATQGRNESAAQTKGNSENISIEYKNKNISELLEKIEAQLERLKTGEAFGMWEGGAYIIARDKKTVAIAAGTYRSLMLGENSNTESSNITLFGMEQGERTKLVLESLAFGNHPKFLIPEMEQSSVSRLMSPTSYINSKELTIFMGLPRKSVNGIQVIEMAEFGRNINDSCSMDVRKINIGNLYHMGKAENTDILLNLDSFTSHCFVTGSTGSGKSNTIYKIIEESCLKTHQVPFLIIEPAKGEYRKEFAQVEDIHIYTTNPYIGELLSINPFQFSSEIHVLEHLDRLIEVFNTCWEMYAAMPAILKDAMEHAYVKRGWDLLNSIYTKEGEPVFPTFEDVLRELPQIIRQSDYSSDTKGDYIGALVTRVKSLTNGIYGQIFCSECEIEESILFDSRTIVDLSRVGSGETKSLIMGILVLRLTEYRMAKAVGSNHRLKHITILEEAHNLLKNMKENNNDANAVVSKSVEMIVNSIAEMRTYGEGFIIVDQSPTSVDIAAIKNTNTKIILRLPDYGDCELVGKSVGLKPRQIDEISRLPVGVAVIMQNNWTEAVLGQIDRSAESYYGEGHIIGFKQLKRFRSEVIKQLIEEFIITQRMCVENVLSTIEQYDIKREKKQEIKRYVYMFSDRMHEKFNSIFVGNCFIKLAACSNIFQTSDGDFEIEANGSVNREKAEAWEERLRAKLKVYIDLDGQYMDVFLQYVLWAMCFANETRNYRLLYDVLYG